MAFDRKKNLDRNERSVNPKRLELPPKVEATIVLQKCPSNNRLLGLRIEKKPNAKWYTVWSFPIDENRAQRENYGTDSVRGDVYAADEYTGCPYCGARYFVQCGRCHKLSCHKGGPTSCPWCGNYMSIFSTGGLDLKGGDF